MQKKSTFGSINWFDAGKGLIVAVLSAVLSTLYTIVSAGGFPNGEQLKTIGGIALTAAISYLMKQFFSNSEGQPLKGEESKQP